MPLGIIDTLDGGGGAKAPCLPPPPDIIHFGGPLVNKRTQNYKPKISTGLGEGLGQDEGSSSFTVNLFLWQVTQLRSGKSGGMG